MTFRLALGVFLAIVIVVAAFAFFIPHANRGGEKAPIVKEEPVLPKISLHDAYKNGVHTIRGVVQAPTPCATVSAIASIGEGTPATIAVDISMPPDTAVCLAQETDLSFTVSATAPSDALITTTLNGIRVETTDPGIL